MLTKYYIILTGPSSASDYFSEIDAFIGEMLGKKAQQLYKIIIDDEEKVAQVMSKGLIQVLDYRKKTGDAFHFNWSIVIESDFQQPFEPNHENMSGLTINYDLPTAELAANLRRIFSGIVAGNVKSSGLKPLENLALFNCQVIKNNGFDGQITGIFY